MGLGLVICDWWSVGFPGCSGFRGACSGVVVVVV